MAIPAGTKLTFHLKPLGPAIDGQSLEPFQVEQIYTADSMKDYDLHDLVPAPDELSGSATLPDGTVEPLRLEGPGDYPNYKSAVSLPLKLDGILGGMAKQSVASLIE